MNRCTLIALFLFISTMVVDDVCSVIRYSTSVRRPDMDDKIINKRMLWRQRSEGLGPCIGECARNGSCAGVFYNRATKTCQGHSITHGHMDGAEVNNNTRYYVQPFGEHYIGDVCDTSQECYITNSECRDRSCECAAGYAFSPGTHECLSDCGIYGHWFTEIPNHFISYSNIEEIESVSIDDCLQLCRNTTAYVCRTLEYGWVSERCSLQNVTKLHNPSEWFEDAARKYNISHFQRDCAIN